MGGLAAVDEITMVVMPDIMTLAGDDGDDVQFRDLQGKMIAHCENAGRPHGDPRLRRRTCSRRRSSSGG